MDVAGWRDLEAARWEGIVGSQGNRGVDRPTSAPPESIKPLTLRLRRLGVTVSAEFMAELEQVRAALSHSMPDGDFESIVRAGFKLLLEQDRKRKGLTEKPRPQKTAAGGRSVPANG